MTKFLRLLPALILLATGVLLVLRELAPPRLHTELAVERFARLPVLEGGRVKPLDTIARTTLTMLRQKQYYIGDDGRRIDASEWLAELMLNPVKAAERRIFRIDHPDVVGLLGFHNEERKYFSLAEIMPHAEALQQQWALVDPEPSQRDPYQHGLVKLQRAVSLYDAAANSLILRSLFGGPVEDLSTHDRIVSDLAENTAERETVMNAWRLLLQHYGRSGNTHILAVPPPSPDGSWQTVAESLMEQRPVDPVVRAYGELAVAWRAQDETGFAAALDQLERFTDARVSEAEGDDLGFEFFFNRAAPFISAIDLYVLAFLAAGLGWLFLPRTFLPTALALLVGAFLIHTFGLLARMDIQDRPPITNLYSSAVFVGWGAVGLCLILELLYRNGIGSAAGALVGFPTLVIAHGLSFSGDTMEMMRAVLDSNFWLATHVVVVTYGYSATFLAGALAVFYLVFDRVVGGRTDEFMASLERMVYGIVCFALLFSFVGTILGGIWADQSWGRFWGWDPKENGALMIVLWNALILHARWARVARPGGIMVLALGGNIITAWSWFGTNLLGVGLHSYGFTSSGAMWLGLFVVSQLGIMLLGLLPVRPRQQGEAAPSRLRKLPAAAEGT